MGSRRRYTATADDGATFAVEGLETPVPGLAIVEAPPCQCGAALYSVMHVRSGSGLFFAHSPESFGPDVWDALARVDWTQSAADMAGDPAVRNAAIAALALVPGAFVGTPIIAPDVASDATSGE